jgi:hypothetical protein
MVTLARCDETLGVGPRIALESISVDVMLLALNHPLPAAGDHNWSVLYDV